MASTSNGGTDDKSRFLDFAKSNPGGVTNEQLKKLLPHLDNTGIAVMMNKCLKEGVIELFHTEDKQMLYKFKDSTARSGLKGSDAEEKMVYKIIEEAGNRGIWIRDIRFKSNLNATALNKVVKSLETKKIIKAVKSVAAHRKKSYMLYDLEPDLSITGGAWYQDQDFDSEFVNVVNDQCYGYLKRKLDESLSVRHLGPLSVRQRSYATASEVQKFIHDLGISNVSLSVADIECILYTVIMDGKAERILATNGSYMYRAVDMFDSSPGIIRTTCGVCPLIHRCSSSNGEINPKRCEFFDDWLR